MSATKLQEGLYAVGVLNPNMRIFDVVMETQWGTSYNAYLVQGKEKTALIEVCHKDFFDQFLSNIRQVTDPSAIDYIILNHCEPDHSGALAALLELCPQAQIVVSKGGSLYLKNITNRADLPFMIAKDQDVLNLGGLELRFIAAPFLHWPDSMFTYWQQEKIAFTCDFLGAHYCEPYLWDRYIAYPKSYRQAFEYYYQGIFGPFKPYVLAGLEKLAALELTTVCPSHGPVLTRQGYLEEAMACYHTWSLPDENQKPELAVFYCSAYGNTAQLGQAIARRGQKPAPRLGSKLLRSERTKLGGNEPAAQPSQSHRHRQSHHQRGRGSAGMATIEPCRRGKQQEKARAGLWFLRLERGSGPQPDRPFTRVKNGAIWRRPKSNLRPLRRRSCQCGSAGSGICQKLSIKNLPPLAVVSRCLNASQGERRSLRQARAVLLLGLQACHRGISCR